MQPGCNEISMSGNLKCFLEKGKTSKTEMFRNKNKAKRSRILSSPRSNEAWEKFIHSVLV